MVTTSPTYRPYKESDIAPVRHTQHDVIHHSREESDETARGRDVWVHGSISGDGEPCRVIRSRHLDMYYCTLSNHLTYGLQKPCTHLQNLLWWLAYERQYTVFEALTDAELRGYERTYARMASGLLVPTRGWDAEQTALGDVIAARLVARRAA
jgi:hypothetical protein